MDPNGPTARRFPLIARPRPTCGPLAVRVDNLVARARAADKDSDTTAASAVYNLAALIASDCGLPDLARQWCHEHAAAYLRAPAMGAQEARHALEPLVNLARLHIRDGNGDAAFHLLDNLYEAVDTRTDTVIDGIPIPAATITTTDTDHRELRRWLWSVHLADGTRALTSAGRWQDAHQHLQARKGIGRRMLDGRQVAVIAHATADDHDGALELLDTTAPGEPWQDAVTACLTALCAEPNNSAIHRTDALKRYRRLVPKPPLAVFQTRLGLSVLDAIGGAEHPAARDLAAHLVTQVIATRDGYIARDLLAHDGCVALINDDQARDIAAALDTSGLGRQAIPSQLRANLSAALATSAAVLARELL